MYYCIVMCSLYKLTALVFLVLWVPITAHCNLEKISGLEFLHCPGETPESSNCEADGCQTVESGAYRIPDNSETVALPIFCVAAYLMAEPVERVQPLLGPFRLPSSAPPDLSRSWQFVSRAALPVRAPSRHS
jgi:hypothetical protein